MAKIKGNGAATETPSQPDAESANPDENMGTGEEAADMKSPEPEELPPVDVTPPVEDFSSEAVKGVDPATPASGEFVDMVTVVAPRAFKLRLDHFRELDIKAGVQEMERAHADHWYSKANGLTIYK